jgi:hypothetical protein
LCYGSGRELPGGLPVAITRRIYFEDEHSRRGSRRNRILAGLLADTEVVSAEKLSLLLKEANELLAICAASLRTAKYNKGA